MLTGILAEVIRESPAFAAALLYAAGVRPRLSVPKQALLAFQERPLLATADAEGGRPDIVFKVGSRLAILEAKAKPVNVSEAVGLREQLSRYDNAIAALSSVVSDDEDPFLQMIGSAKKRVQIALVGGRQADLPDQSNFGTGVNVLTWEDVRVLLVAEPNTSRAAACLATVLADPDVALRLGCRVEITPYYLSRMLRAAFFDEGLRKTIHVSIVKKLDSHWDERRIASPWTDAEPGWKYSGATSRWIHSKKHPLRLKVIRTMHEASGSTGTNWVWSFPFELASKSSWFRANRDLTGALGALGSERKTKSGQSQFWITPSDSRNGSKDLNLCSADVESAVLRDMTAMPGRSELLQICQPASEDRLVSGFWAMVLEQTTK
ncbi:MAG: hypothetical protein Q8O67_31805 [Deltaproteobacteria bacterium]|nr:hypothetical protein [Deltaproteobacteria bacterium]